MTVTNYYENIASRDSVALCQESRWYKLTDKSDNVTCKRCLHLMKAPIEEIREARRRAAKRIVVR